MIRGRFHRYELRTTDMSSARAFYADVLGADCWSVDVTLAALPDRAVAQGVPAHWLGHIGVDDVEGTAARAVALGSQQLGPTQRAPDGSARAHLRDPFGAVMIVDAGMAAPRHGPVEWHLLHAQDEERAFAFYADLFGWQATAALDLGPELSRHQLFAWDDSGRSVGSIANTVRLPHVHPHWLFCFRVADVAAALSRVRAVGGTAWGPTSMANGDLVAPCEDLQNAAFALYQRAPPVS